MAVIVAAAVLTSVIHVLLAAVGTRAIELLHRAAEAIGRMIAPVLIHVKNQPNLRLPSVSSAHHFRQNFSVGMPWRRGPPAWGIAAL